MQAQSLWNERFVSEWNASVLNARTHEIERLLRCAARTFSTERDMYDALYMQSQILHSTGNRAEAEALLLRLQGLVDPRREVPLTALERDLAGVASTAVAAFFRDS